MKYFETECVCMALKFENTLMFWGETLFQMFTGTYNRSERLQIRIIAKHGFDCNNTLFFCVFTLTHFQVLTWFFFFALEATPAHGEHWWTSSYIVTED